MKKRLVKKSWCFAIILFFVGASFLPSVMSETQKTSTFMTMQNTWYVDDSGDDSNGGTNWSDAWQHIYYAIGNDNVSNGDTIMVGNGIYNENIVVDKVLNISGNDSSDTIIDGNELDFVILISSTNEVIISGFTVRNGNNRVITIDNSNGCNISNNVIYNDKKYGFGVTVINGNGTIIFCNEIYNLNVGLQIKNESMNTEISYNDIHHNNWGIDQVKHSEHSTIKRNNIRYSASQGIFLDAARFDTITENNFEENPLWQAFFQDSYWINWNGNFWDDHPGGRFPRIIFGWRTRPFPFFMINFDWHPAKDRFDITCP